MNQQELQQFVLPYEINKGHVLEGETIEFEIKNNSPFPFLCFEQSCGCLGETTLEEFSFKAKLTATGAGASASTHQMFKVGDKYAQMHHTQNGPKFYDPINQLWIPNEDIPENPEKVAVINFYQTITLWMDDGLDIYRISDKGQLETNSEKSRIIIPIRFLIIKKA